MVSHRQGFQRGSEKEKGASLGTATTRTQSVTLAVLSQYKYLSRLAWGKFFVWVFFFSSLMHQNQGLERFGKPICCMFPYREVYYFLIRTLGCLLGLSPSAPLLSERSCQPGVSAKQKSRGWSGFKYPDAFWVFCFGEAGRTQGDPEIAALTPPISE